MKVALYARVSSDRQDVDLSISAQLRALREHAEQRGYEMIREYVDEAESGRTADRPQFQRMVAEVRKSSTPFQAVLVWKYSRYARSREDSIVYKTLLRKHGVDVLSINEPSDSSPTGKLLEAIIESLDEFYSANLAQETVRGMRESASRGSYITPRPPYGYIRTKVKDGSRDRFTLIPDPETAPIVKNIFDDVLHGQGLKEICQKLNRAGVGRRQGGQWTKTSLHYLVTNETYTGTLVWGRSSQHGHATTPVRVEDAWEALVDRDTFEQVRSKMEERAPRTVHPTRLTSRYLLSGIVHCSTCDKALIGQEAKHGQYSYYVCGTLMRQGAGTCDAPYLNAGKFEQFIVDRIKEQILTEGNLRRLVEMASEEFDERTLEHKQQIDHIESRLADNQGRLDRLYGAVETGKLSLDDLAPRIHALREEQDSLRRSRDEAQEALLARNASVSGIEDAVSCVDDLRQALTDGEFTERKAFIRTFVRRIDITKKSAAVTYSIPMPGNGKREECLPVLGAVRVGSPSTIKGRTFACTFELPRREKKPATPRDYPNPLVLAQGWQRLIDSGQVASRADLARQLGVSRAHVTQVLRLLLMAPGAVESVLALGDPIEGRFLGAHTLRSLARLPTEEQERRIYEIIENNSSVPSGRVKRALPA